MAKPRKLKTYEKELDEKLDIEKLVATGSEGNSIYAMNPDTSVPDCPICHQRMKNHGKFERIYIDVMSGDDGKPRYIDLHYLFYKYRCLNEDCELTLYQKPIEFANDNANVTKRMEDQIVRYASYLSYAQVENKILSSVTKQAVGQIISRWVANKDDERGNSFYSPRTLGLLSFSWDNGKYSYILAIDAGHTDLYIFDVIRSIDTDSITVLLNKMDKSKIKYVVTDCNYTVVSAARDQLPDSEILVDTDVLFDSTVDGFKEILRKDAMHTPVRDKELLLTNPSEIDKEEGLRIKRITEQKPKVSNGYDHLNRLRSMLSNAWDVTDIREWANQIPLDCQSEFLMPSEYIDEYWAELINFYQRRREVTPALYQKLKTLDEKLRKFRSCTDDVFRAKILYLCMIGKDMKNANGNWRGVPYANVMKMLDSLLNEMED